MPFWRQSENYPKGRILVLNSDFMQLSMNHSMPVKMAHLQKETWANSIKCLLVPRKQFPSRTQFVNGHLPTSSRIEISFSVWARLSAKTARPRIRLLHPWALFSSYRPRFDATSGDISCTIFTLREQSPVISSPRSFLVPPLLDLISCKPVDKYIMK